MGRIKGSIEILALCFLTLWLCESLVLWEPDLLKWSLESRRWFVIIYLVMGYIFLGANGFLWSYTQLDEEEELEALNEEMNRLDEKAKALRG